MPVYSPAVPKVLNKIPWAWFSSGSLIEASALEWLAAQTTGNIQLSVLSMPVKQMLRNLSVLPQSFSKTALLCLQPGCSLTRWGGRWYEASDTALHQFPFGEGCLSSVVI